MHPRRLDRDQPQRGAGDDTGQPHAAGRRPEQLRRRRSGDTREVPVGVTSVISHDVPGEAAVTVVVLAVDVGGDRSADRDVARPRVSPARTILRE